MINPNEEPNGETKLKTRKREFIKYLVLVFLAALASGMVSGYLTESYLAGAVGLWLPLLTGFVVLIGLVWFTWDYFGRIDEIDLHLHPKWQRRVVGDLIKAFPNIQFVASTHSPFIIQSLPPKHDVKLINLDDGELNDFTDRSVEDIVEWVQGVELPQRSQHHVEMMKAAEEYFSLLDEDDPEISADAMESKREELQKAIQVHTDNPAYHAFIRMKEIAGGKVNGSKERFKGRNRSVIDPDDIESKRDKGSDGEMMSGGSE